jgi:PAS domain S-box-containing protein
MKKVSDKPKMPSREELLAENEDLKSRLMEAEETLRAIRSGEVDALAIETAEGAQVFTLKGAEQPYRFMVETMSEGALTLFPDGTIIYCNQRFAELVKTPLESIIGQSIFRFIKPGQDEFFKKFVGQISKVDRTELTLAAIDGSAIPVLLSMSELRDATPGAICLLATDLTELRKTQQALQESHDKLEIHVEERTADLKVKTEQLEAANRELESFSYSVSHDLRAPLRAIDGFVRILLKKHGPEFDSESLSKFNVIRSSAQKMGQLIEDLLTYSRLGRASLSAAELNMGKIIREVWIGLEEGLPERRLSLKINPLPPCRGDLVLIRQVLVNLLGNAVKFTKDREEAIIEAGGRVDGNENVFYVRDNGIGFSMEFRDKIFGVFQRLHGPEDFEGTGVGLAIVKRLIHRHGGRVWAEGKENEGAIFYFTLPSSHTHTHTHKMSRFRDRT